MEDNKSVKFARLLFASKMPEEMKNQWLKLIPKMKTAELQELYGLLEDEAKKEHVFRAKMLKDWDRVNSK